jgi:HK97 gp10 family phage protein
MSTVNKGGGVTVDIKFYDVTKAIGAITDRNMRTKFAEVMVEVAKEKAPPPPKMGDVPHTGNNRREISILSGSNGSYAIGTMSGYGGYLEFGTKHMPARPYFLPAADVARKSIEGTGPGDWQR